MSKEEFIKIINEDGKGFNTRIFDEKGKDITKGACKVIIIAETHGPVKAWVKYNLARVNTKAKEQKPRDILPKDG